MIGEFLYGLTPRDEQQAQVEYFQNRLVLIQAAGQLSVQLDVPFAKVALLQSVSVELEGLGGQVPVRVFGTLGQVGGLSHTFMLQEFPAATARNGTDRQWEGKVVAPQHRLLFLADFSGGAANNILTVGVSGLLIPRGTLGVSQL